MRKISMIIVSILMVSSLLVGCQGASNEVSPMNAPDNQTPEPAGDSVQNSEPQTEEKDEAVENIPEQPSVLKWKVALYFSDSEGMNIIKKEKEMAFEEEGVFSIEKKAKLAIEALIEGIEGEDVTTTIPPETKVLSVTLEGKTLVVDFSKEFEQNHFGGSTGIMMTMAPLVLTLTEYKEVEEVKFIVEGKVLEEFKGHIEFNRPFARGEYTQYLK